MQEPRPSGKRIERYANGTSMTLGFDGIEQVAVAFTFDGRKVMFRKSLIRKKWRARTMGVEVWGFINKRELPDGNIRLEFHPDTDEKLHPFVAALIKKIGAIKAHDETDGPMRFGWYAPFWRGGKNFDRREQQLIGLLIRWW